MVSENKLCSLNLETKNNISFVKNQTDNYLNNRQNYDLQECNSNFIGNEMGIYSAPILGKEGEFAGYASVFNIEDKDHDILVKGAFSNIVEQDPNNIKLLWQHKQDMPIGIISKLYEDDYGLFVEGRILLETEKGKEAYNLLKNNAISGLSIGFIVKDYEYDYEQNVRYLYQVDLLEISIVTFPANDHSYVRFIKSEDFNKDQKNNKDNKDKENYLEAENLVFKLEEVINILK